MNIKDIALNQLGESDEAPPERKDPYTGSSFGHKSEARYHRARARKHTWDSEQGKYHSTKAAHHESVARVLSYREKAAAKAHKKLHGADEATYRTGHEVVKSSGGRFNAPSNHKYGTVTKHTASQFHVKWDHDGSETSHRQSDGAQSGSSYPTRNNFYSSGSGGASHLPYKSGGGGRMTKAEHSSQHREYEHKKKTASDRAERVARAQKNLASHRHEHVSDKHLEAMEALHHEITRHHAEKED